MPTSEDRAAKRCGPLAVWCPSFDSILCSKGGELWDTEERMNCIDPVGSAQIKTLKHMPQLALSCSTPDVGVGYYRSLSSHRWLWLRAGCCRNVAGEERTD